MVRSGRQARGRWRLLAFFVGAVVILTACGTPPIRSPMPTQAQPPTVQRPPSSPPPLPPTWTPTDTPSPAPPTATRTAAPPPSPTPTPDDAARCAAFALLSQPRDGGQLALRMHRSVTFIWNYPLPGEAVTLTLIQEASGLGRALTVPGPDTVVASLPFHALYGPGPYRWVIAPLGQDGQPLESCGVEGRFLLVARTREDRPWPLP